MQSNDGWQKARNGDLSAFEMLCRPHQPRMMAVAARLTNRDQAEDIVMEAMLHAWRHIPELRNPNALGAWLCRIVRNKALAELRREKRRPTCSLETLPADHSSNLIDNNSCGPDEKLAREDDLTQLHHALDKLPEHLQLPLMLRYADELSYREISAALSLPIGTVMSRLFSARRLLKKNYEE